MTSWNFSSENWESPNSIIKRLGLKPLHSLGQNFLTDKNLLLYIANAIQLGDEDAIIEIGPGTGALTQFLSQRKLPYLCVEIDKGLSNFLKLRFESEYLKVHHGDVLDGKQNLNTELLKFLDYQCDQGKHVKWISNLPYHILTPFIWNLMLLNQKWQEAVFLVQKEFSDRLVAKIGSKNYSPLTVATAHHLTVKTLKKVHPHNFWPSPSVGSTIIHLKPKRDKPINPNFFHMLKNVFAHRRKTLVKNLKQAYPGYNASPFFLKHQLAVNVRCEQLSPDLIYSLFQDISN